VKPAQLTEALRAVEDARIAAKLAAETIAAQQAEIRRLEGVAFKGEGKLGNLIAETAAVLGELDDRADVDTLSGEQRPDWVMRLANTLRDALNEARK
jgi:hypothetical protein